MHELFKEKRSAAQILRCVQYVDREKNVNSFLYLRTADILKLHTFLITLLRLCLLCLWLSGVLSSWNCGRGRKHF